MTGRPAGGPAGLLVGADVDPATGTLLSIAQLQSALRTSAAGLPRRARPYPVEQSRAPLVPGRSHPGVLTGPGRDGSSTLAGQGPEQDGRGGLPLWLGELGGPPVLMLAAHPGAGCSTAAVAVAEAPRPVAARN